MVARAEIRVRAAAHRSCQLSLRGSVGGPGGRGGVCQVDEPRPGDVDLVCTGQVWGLLLPWESAWDQHGLWDLHLGPHSWLTTSYGRPSSGKSQSTSTSPGSG